MAIHIIEHIAETKKIQIFKTIVQNENKRNINYEKEILWFHGLYDMFNARIETEGCVDLQPF